MNRNKIFSTLYHGLFSSFYLLYKISLEVDAVRICSFSLYVTCQYVCKCSCIFKNIVYFNLLIWLFVISVYFCYFFLANVCACVSNLLAFIYRYSDDSSFSSNIIVFNFFSLLNLLIFFINLYIYFPQIRCLHINSIKHSHYNYTQKNERQGNYTVLVKYELQ